MSADSTMMIPSDTALANIRAEQVRRWRAGDRTPVEEILNRHPSLGDDTEAVMVLIHGEVLLREELDGTLPELSEFTQRFPSMTDALTAQFDFHRKSHSTAGFAPPQIPDFQIVRELGRGGMGMVYLARDEKLKREIAVKVLLSGEFASESARQRFRTEAEAIARLTHPNIVEVHAFGETCGRPYLMLEYIDGGSLDERLKSASLEPRFAAQMLIQLADAVDHAHRNGILHRDLKPANVLLQKVVSSQQKVVSSQYSVASRKEAACSSTDYCLLTTDYSPKIADFGLAKRLDASAGVSDTSQILGTPSYMAPEQCSGAKDVGPAADIYSLGAIQYECLTGRPPFKAATAIETLAQVMDREPVSPRTLNPAVPRDLETICLKCLSKDPAKRYSTAAGLAEDLQRYLSGRPVVARPVGTVGKVWRWAKRRPALASMIAGLAILIPSALAAMTALYLNADRHRELTEEREREMLRWRVANAKQMSRHAVELSHTRPITETAIAANRRSAEELERLAALGIDPVANRVQRAEHLDRVVFCYIQMGRATEALEASPQAVAAAEACLAEQPESELQRFGYQNARHNHAASLRLARRLDEAIQVFDALIGELHSTYGPSSTWNRRNRQWAANLYFDRAMSRYERRHHADAVSDYDFALQYDDGDNWIDLTLMRSISLAHCGRAAEAIEQCCGPLSNPHLNPGSVYDAAGAHAAASVAPELTTPQREAAAREAVELLKRAIAGNAKFRASAAKEREFLPLHDRADFQAAIAPVTGQRPGSPDKVYD